MPLLKPIAKSVGKQAIRSGISLAGDILEGHNPKEAFKQNLKDGTNKLFQKVVKINTPPKKNS